MHAISDTLDFFFERFVQLPQCPHCILKPAVCHLIWRQAFREELRARAEQILSPLLIFFIAKQPFDSLVVKGSDLHKALLFRDRSAAEFIRPAQGGFSPARGICAQQREVLLVENRLRCRLAPGSRFHARIPVSRTTNMSASSF